MKDGEKIEEIFVRDQAVNQMATDRKSASIPLAMEAMYTKNRASGHFLARFGGEDEVHRLDSEKSGGGVEL